MSAQQSDDKAGRGRGTAADVCEYNAPACPPALPALPALPACLTVVLWRDCVSVRPVAVSDVSVPPRPLLCPPPLHASSTCPTTSYALPSPVLHTSHRILCSALPRPPRAPASSPLPTRTSPCPATRCVVCTANRTATTHSFSRTAACPASRTTTCPANHVAMCPANRTSFECTASRSLAKLV